MQRCLELAQLAGGNVSTNPMVGAIIVHNNRIIGEGYHQICGGAHAEVNAFQSVEHREKDLLKESTMYVSLEPCCHWGKTPPCCDLIIKNGIKRVVIAMKDPFERVCGEGVGRMKQAGIEVVTGVLKERAEELNRRFITFHTKKRPYILLKWARTVDGYIDSDRDKDTPMSWITGESCRILVHKWRSEEDAIWVGKQTVLRDNPELTNRKWYGKNPIRISMDNNKEITPRYAIRNNHAQTILFESKSIEQIIENLYQNSIQSVMVEGGAMLLNYLIKHNLYDEIREFVSPIRFNLNNDANYKGVKSPLPDPCNLIQQSFIGAVELKIYRNRDKKKNK